MRSVALLFCDVRLTKWMQHADVFEPFKVIVAPAQVATLGSIAVHIEEYFSPKGVEIDKIEIQRRLQDPELRQWMDAMTKLSYLPVKR